MLNVLRTLFIIAIVVLFSWLIRLSYIGWFEPKGSVLDRYSEHAGNVSAKTVRFEDLVRSYDEMYHAVESYESNSNNPVLTEEEKMSTEPYKTEYELKCAIDEWEEKDRRISELRFYGTCGLALILSGLAVYWKVNRFLGLSFLIAGFAVMLAYIDPSRYGTSGKIVFTKIAFGSLTLVLLIITGYVTGIVREEGS